MSFQSVLSKSDHKNNSSFLLSDNLCRIRGSLDKSIVEDLPLLRSNIGFSQLTQSIPELKKYLISSIILYLNQLTL